MLRTTRDLLHPHSHARRRGRLRGWLCFATLELALAEPVHWESFAFHTCYLVWSDCDNERWRYMPDRKCELDLLDFSEIEPASMICHQREYCRQTRRKKGLVGYWLPRGQRHCWSGCVVETETLHVWWFYTQSSPHRGPHKTRRFPAVQHYAQTRVEKLAPHRL